MQILYEKDLGYRRENESIWLSNNNAFIFVVLQQLGRNSLSREQRNEGFKRFLIDIFEVNQNINVAFCSLVRRTRPGAHMSYKKTNSLGLDACCVWTT